MAETGEARWASRALFLKIKGADEPQYRIGLRCGIPPGVVTALIRGYAPVSPDDPRVLKLAAAVGLPPERAFSKRPPTWRR
jgi:hypothetical protein